jgi:hypothetical protein
MTDGWKIGSSKGLNNKPRANSDGGTTNSNGSSNGKNTQKKYEHRELHPHRLHLSPLNQKRKAERNHRNNGDAEHFPPVSFVKGVSSYAKK